MWQVTDKIFVKLLLPWQYFVRNSHIEYHENPKEVYSHILCQARTEWQKKDKRIDVFSVQIEFSTRKKCINNTLLHNCRILTITMPFLHCFLIYMKITLLYNRIMRVQNNQQVYFCHQQLVTSWHSVKCHYVTTMLHSDIYQRVGCWRYAVINASQHLLAC